jgi:sterol desaturase/sphingolipid hydroxylase (fatty acid hydroxylase superfamily)
MDDLAYGKRNKRGDWSPNEPAQIAPIWAMPPRLTKVLKWLPGYFLPYEPIWILSALAVWFFVLPDVETMKTLSFGWIAKLFIFNVIAIFAFYGAVEFRLYYQRAQGNRFKFNAKWPNENPSDVFWFKSQNIDSALRILFHAMPIWTAIEVFILWMFANGHVQWLSWEEHKWWLVALIVLNPFLHELHFYVIHRLIHIPFLYKHVHSVHHNSVNPSPLSSLSMHPVELILYLGMACWQLIIPSNPIVAIYALHRAGFGAIPGHVGFDRIEIGKENAVNMHAYVHYLHHKYFEVNYGDGLIPLDKVFGTFHDGSKEGDEMMNARFEKKRARMNAKAG